MTEPWWDIIPRKREAADVLLCDESGRPMIVQNSWNDAWTLPGGALNHGEPPRRGAEREIEEELGLRIEIGRLLLVDWEPPIDDLPIDGLMSLFDGGTLDDKQIARIRLQESEVRAFRFVEPDELPANLGRGLRAGVTAKRDATTLYLENGYQR
jgi:8-oxo-dGTP diphosphatase